MSETRRLGGHAASHPEAPLGHDVELLVSDVRRHVLPNGLVVLIKEVYPASVVGISVWSRVGSVDEADELAGLSHFLEHMLFKGTPRRPVGKIAQEIHSLGGYLNGFTTYDCTCYWIVLPSRCFTTALDIEADAILHPLLDPNEIAKEAKVIVEELKMYEDRPDSYCYQKLMETAFTTHRYGRPIIGYEDVIHRTTVDQLAAHYKRFYRPNNMCVTVVGDVRADQALAQIEEELGHLEPGAIVRDQPPQEPLQEHMRTLHLEGDISTAHLQMGFHIPSIFNDDTFACDILASIMGEGRSSRLFRRLRERESLVNSVGASIFSERDPGLFVVSATLQADHLDASFDAVLDEVTRLRDDGIEQRELQKAKNMVEASYIFSQETVEGQGRKLGYYEMIGDWRLSDRYVEKLYQVTSEDVVRAARRYLSPDNCSVVTYRPRHSTPPKREA